MLAIGEVVCAGAQEAANERVARELEEGKGRLVLPAGVHVFRAPLVVDLARLGAVSIRGDGPVTIRMEGAGPAIRVVGTHEGTADPRSFREETWLQRMPMIEGFEIVGGHPEADGIELRGTMQATLSRVSVRKARHGIRLVGRNRNVVISDCHLYENRGIGVFLDNVNLHQINVANSHISYNRGGGVVVRDGEVRNLHVTGCDLEANMPGDETPTTTANVLLDQSRPGVRSSIAEVAITGCTIQHSAHYGKTTIAPGGANIRVLGHADHLPNMITITGNILSDTTTHLHLDRVMDVTVTGNTFFTTEPTDVLVENSERVTLSGNAFNPREEGAVGGIVLRASSHCLLQGMTVHRFRGEAAILLERCHASRVSQCLLSETRAGLELRDCVLCTVSDCTVTGLPDGVEAVVATGERNRVREILTDREEE